MRIEDDVLQLVKARNEVVAELAALRDELAEVDRRLRAVLLEDYGVERMTFRYGPDVVRVQPRVTRRIRKDREAELQEWLESVPHLFRRIYNLGYPRWGELRDVADTFYRDVDHWTGEVVASGWDAFRARFVEVEEGTTPEVSVVPAAKAPVFSRKLADGEGIAR